MSAPIRKISRSQKGQTLIELTLIFPLMILLAYGAIEVGSVISTYLTITHTSREGANLASRGETPNNTLDAIIASSAPTIRGNNVSQWRIIYSEIEQREGEPCNPSCTYEIKTQLIRGNLAQNSKIGSEGAVANSNLPELDNVAPGQIFHAIEVYYDYEPNIVTFVGRSLNKMFYDRTIFTNVSGAR
jgi:hypothetical protein